uniref:Uncharacterized protein n=1 Tax=Heliothis virescens TaxID=7102 RepID=A0A2A4JEP7_HELVI
MMELTCAVLLLSASLVTATPYGYGVKGGAAARAESSASAGAFGGVGDIPVAIPLGASYSGSFSKSSSSSSSSSSASSSSSSSSFSYSGSGANSFGLNGAAHGNGGCSSGSCPNAGGSGVPVPHDSSSGASGSGSNAGAHGSAGCSSGSCPNAGDSGSSPTHGSSSEAAGYGLNGGAHGNGGCSSGSCPTGTDNAVSAPHSSSSGYSTANAAAIAGAGSGALSGPGCKGLSCDGNSEKCTSGQCKSNSPSGSTTSPDSSKCASGQCGPTPDVGVTSADNESNDIRAVTNSARNDQSSNFDKTYNAANSDCSHGNCNSAGPLSSKPNYYGSGNSNQGSNALNQQQSSSSDSGATSYYQKPSTHLETPKLSSKCNSGNCDAEPVGPSGSYGSSPSSYNVPIHGAYNGGAQKPNCDGVKCDNQPKGPYSSPNTNTFTSNYQQHSPSSDNYVTKEPSYNSPSSNCAGANCFGAPANQNTRAPTPTPAPLNFGQQPFLNLPGHTGHTKPSDINKPSTDKLPAYTGGFGGPAGVLNPNEYDVAAPAPTSNPSHAHGTTSQNVQPSGSYPTGCNSPSCSGYPSTSGSITPSGSYGHKPSASTPSEKLPTYTGGFGGPAGMLNPNEHDIHSGSSSHNTQSPVNSIGITGCKTGNCGAYSPNAGPTTGAISPGYTGSTKPSTGIISSDKLPTYTGGFGGPEGVFNPNKYDTHQTGPTGSAHTPSGTYISPTTGGCTTTNCYSPLGGSATANANAQPIGITKPSSGAHPATVPSYTGGYHGPSSVNTPNEISATVSGPNYTPTQSQSTPGSYPGGCKTGNCGVYPISGSSSADANTQSGSFGVTKPAYANPVNSQYTGGYNGQSGAHKPDQHVTPTTGSGTESCKTPNCASSPTASGGVTSGVNTQSGSNSQTGSYGTTKPSGPTYTGGFGGAPGLLNPNEYTIPAAGATPNNKPTGVSKPAACTSGNCSPQQPQGSTSHSHNDASNTAHAAAAADANAVIYTGGFGGPPGVLEPYDDGKGGAKPAHGSHVGGYSSPNANIHSAHGTPGANSGSTGPAVVPGAHGNGAHAGSSAGSAAFAGAVAGASAGSQGYNTHGSHYNQAGNTKGGSPCGGGCGGSTGGAYNGGLSAGAHNAGLGFDYSGGVGSPKLGYSDGLSGAGSLSAATAKSLAGANAFGLGGSFASSSASAHASAGAYTKGGYGKR